MKKHKEYSMSTMLSWTKQEIVEQLLQMNKENEQLQKSNFNLSAAVDVLESEKSNLFRTLEEINEIIKEIGEINALLEA